MKVISDEKRQELETKFTQEECLKQELAALEGVGKLSPFCEKLTYTISAWLYDGAQSCDCNKQGSTSLNCNPKGGQCDCRPGVTGRQCDECHPGFYGFSANGCTECKCNEQGTVNANQVNYRIQWSLFLKCNFRYVIKPRVSVNATLVSVDVTAHNVCRVIGASPTARSANVTATRMCATKHQETIPKYRQTNPGHKLVMNSVVGFSETIVELNV